MDESRIRTIEQVRAVLDGTQSLTSTPSTDRYARCAWVSAALARLRYRSLKRNQRGLVLRYLRQLSDFSRVQVTRLVRRCMRLSPLARPRHAPSNAFARRYTEEDLTLLAEVGGGQLSGPAMVVILRRMYQVYGDERFVRLQHLSASHLYNLRRSAVYQAYYRHWTKTRRDYKAAAIAIRRAPAPESRPGFFASIVSIRATCMDASSLARAALL